jgi:hypothetical protein
MADDFKPQFLRIPDATRIYGESRSGWYRKAPLHPGLLVKNGTATLACCKVADEIYASLPAASIKPAPARSAA